MKETLHWKDATKELPGNSRSVLVKRDHNMRGVKKITEAYLCRGPWRRWCFPSGHNIAEHISIWSEMPKGPRSRKGKL